MTPILLTLLACTPAETAQDSGTPTDGQWDGNTGPYITDGEQTEVPDVDLDALGADLGLALAQVMTINAIGVIEAYAAVADGMDADCPEWYESEGNPYWYDSCQSVDGTQFEGYAFLLPLEGYADEEGTVYDGYQFYGIASVLDETGRAFQARGGAGIFSAVTAEGALVSYSYLEAGFYDSAATGTWLAEAMDPALTTWAAWYPEAGGAATMVDGMLTDLDGDLEVLVLDDVVVSQEVLGGCPLEPSATVSVLDGEGRWVDVVFSADQGATDPLCDGCGTAYHQGQVLGAVCTDFGPLLDWELSPWW